MAEALRPDLRIVEGLSLDPLEAARTSLDPKARALAAVRAARPIVDRLGRAERRRIAAVVTCDAAAPEHGVAVARLTASGLSLAESPALHVSGLGRCGLFAALHVGRALMRAFPDGLVLLVRPGDSEAGGGQPGALLLAREGGVACRPLPPACAGLPRHADAETRDALCGAALALSFARAGVSSADIRRVAGPGTSFAECAGLMERAGLAHAFGASPDGCMTQASTPEEALGVAAQAPPAVRTLLWARNAEGRMGACLLEPD